MTPSFYWHALGRILEPFYLTRFWLFCLTYSPWTICFRRQVCVWLSIYVRQRTGTGLTWMMSYYSHLFRGLLRWSHWSRLVLWSFQNESVICEPAFILEWYTIFPEWLCHSKTGYINHKWPLGHSRMIWSFLYGHIIIMSPVIPFGLTNASMAGDWYVGHTSDYHRFKSVMVSNDDF